MVAVALIRPQFARFTFMRLLSGEFRVKLWERSIWFSGALLFRDFVQSRPLELRSVSCRMSQITLDFMLWNSAQFLQYLRSDILHRRPMILALNITNRLDAIKHDQSTSRDVAYAIRQKLAKWRRILEVDVVVRHALHETSENKSCQLLNAPPPQNPREVLQWRCPIVRTLRRYARCRSRTYL